VLNDLQLVHARNQNAQHCDHQNQHDHGTTLEQPAFGDGVFEFSPGHESFS
jgi:hypothetical protein